MRISDWSSDVCSSDLPIETMRFELVDKPNWVGLRKQRMYGGDQAEEEGGHPVIFPNFLLSPQREHIVMHMRLPVDDTHTKDRKSVVSGKSVSVRVDTGGRPILKKNKNVK